MRFAGLIFAVAIGGTAGAAGPFSKFSSRTPVADYTSSRASEEIERCLIDMDGWLAPNVYRQPDKPDEVKILWIAGGMTSGIAGARVDLTRLPSGETRVVSWMPAKQAKACAPDKTPSQSN